MLQRKPRNMKDAQPGLPSALSWIWAMLSNLDVTQGSSLPRGSQPDAAHEKGDS